MRGTVPFLFHDIILQLQREEAEQVSLCIAPGHNCEQPLAGEKPFIRTSLLTFLKRGSLLFDMEGIDHFNSRFRPRYENSLVCSPPAPQWFPTLTALGAVLATMWIFGLLKISPLKLARLVWIRRQKQRTHLTHPESPTLPLPSTQPVIQSEQRRAC